MTYLRRYVEIFPVHQVGSTYALLLLCREIFLYTLKLYIKVRWHYSFSVFRALL